MYKEIAKLCVNSDFEHKLKKKLKCSIDSECKPNVMLIVHKDVRIVRRLVLNCARTFFTSLCRNVNNVVKLCVWTATTLANGKSAWTRHQLNDYEWGIVVFAGLQCDDVCVFILKRLEACITQTSTTKTTATALHIYVHRFNADYEQFAPRTVRSQYICNGEVLRWCCTLYNDKPKSKYKAKAISIQWCECCTKAFDTDTLAEICGNATTDTPIHAAMRVCFSTKNFSALLLRSDHAIGKQNEWHTAKIMIVTESNETNGGMSKRNSDKRFAFTLNEWICMGSSAHAIEQTYKTKLKFSSF